MRRSLVPILFAKPGWVLPGATVDMDFANNRAWRKGGGLILPASLLTTTRASTGYAATSSGLLVSFASNTPRITDLGLLVEQAATNVVLWNRDITNAAWTKSNITAALNQTGADGTANSATSLTATAGNGTCLQAITLASSARFQSAYVKRITGSGTINMTMDNGATWTAIVVTAAYTQLTIPTQTLANPTVGFRIVTSGDAIAVDLVGNETGTFATSPIATTTVAVTRAADVVTVSDPTKILTPSGTILIAYNLEGINPNQAEAWAMSDAGNNRLALRSGGNNTTPSFLVGSGSGVGNATGSSTGIGVNVKLASAWGASSASLSQNGAVAVSVGNGWSGVSAGTFWIGRSDNSSTQLDGVISRFTAYKSQLSDTQLQALTT